MKMHAGRRLVRNAMYGFFTEEKLCFRREHKTKGILRECWYTRDQLPDAALDDGWSRRFVEKAMRIFDERRKEMEN